MSSNIRVSRICQHCGKEFIAKTTVTKYCSDDCAKRAYKKRKRHENIQRSDTETTQVKLQPMQTLQGKEYLSIQETCALLGISRMTLYRLIKDKKLKATKIGRRTIIYKQNIQKLFE